MAAAVEVLCPSGHRQKVKITPNTKILQVLEEVCTKKGFLPTEEYELRHGRKTLDVTLTVRFAGLPNHAKLELVKAEKTREESEVTIALQVEDARLQHTFSPGVTLWQVLEHWEQQPNSLYKDRLRKGSSPNLHPVCTYMREEVVGEFALRETTLRMLGLTGGRAMFRLSHREVDQNVLDSTREKIEKEKSRQAKLLAKVQEREPNTQATSVTSKSSKEETKPQSKAPEPSSSSSEVPMDTETSLELTNSKSVKQNAPPSNAISSSLNQPNEPMEDEVAGASGSSEQPMDEVLTSGAQAMRAGTLVQGMSATQRQEASLQALENMPGVSVVRPGDFDDLSPEQQEKARRMAAEAFPGMFPSSSQSARPKKKQITNPQPAANPFANFKFPEATKGQDLYKNELSDVNKEDFEPCDRETCLYSLDEEEQSSASGGSDDLPDDFFDVTVSDVQRMYSDLQKNTQGMEEQSLMTSTMRKQMEEERISKYPRVVIRVQFPDRLVLQGVFRPRETIFALQKFVKEHIEDKSKPFYLYTTPPKYVLKDNAKTLYEAKLIPLTVVHYGSETKKDHNLSDAVLCEIGPRNVADQVVYKHMKDKSGEGTSEYRPRPKRSGPSTATASTSKGEQPKLPKWFKLGKK